MNYMSWLYDSGHGLMKCTLSLSGEGAKVEGISAIKLVELNPVNACRGFPMELTLQGWPYSFVKILEECVHNGFFQSKEVCFCVSAIKSDLMRICNLWERNDLNCMASKANTL